MRKEEELLSYLLAPVSFGEVLPHWVLTRLHLLSAHMKP